MILTKKKYQQQKVEVVRKKTTIKQKFLLWDSKLSIQKG